MEYVKIEFKGFGKGHVKKLAKQLANSLREYEIESFMLGISYPYYISNEERKKLRKSFQYKLVKFLEKELDAKANYSDADASITLDLNKDIAYIHIKPIYIYGRYKKLVEMPQTRLYCFKCKGKGCKECCFKGVISSESVEQLLAKHACKAFEAEDAILHGAGREDIDVLMLGKGREFVLEVVKPKKRKISLKKLEEEINKEEENKLQVMLLRYATKKDVVSVKNKKSEKLYSAIVECSEVISKEKLGKLKGKIEIKQKTPTRMLRRKRDKVRIKYAEILEVKPISEREFEIKIRASSGLYVKEFISGDNARTEPSISSILGKKCICKKLVCLDILD